MPGIAGPSPSHGILQDRHPFMQRPKSFLLARPTGARKDRLTDAGLASLAAVAPIATRTKAASQARTASVSRSFRPPVGLVNRNDSDRCMEGCRSWRMPRLGHRPAMPGIDLVGVFGDLFKRKHAQVVERESW